MGGRNGKTLDMSLVAHARLLGSALPTVSSGLHVSVECTDVSNGPVSIGSVQRKASFATVTSVSGADKAASCAGLTLARVVPSN